MDSKDYCREIAALASITAQDAKEFTEAQGIKMVLDYIEKGEISIPYLGTIKISHVKDELQKNGVVAIVETAIELDPYLIRSIGQAADSAETEAEKLYTAKIRRLMKQTLREF